MKLIIINVKTSLLLPLRGI